MVSRGPSISLGRYPSLAHLCLLMFVLPRHAIQGLVGALPLVHPELRLLHDGPQLVQVLFDLLVVVHILAGNEQLNLKECGP